MSNLCNICCEKYNKGSHTKVTCEQSECLFSACKTCIRTYLLGTTADPNCMNCKKAWSDQFLVRNLNRVFCEKDYKKHRKELLLERELSKLPETMVHAERQRKVDNEELRIPIVNNQMLELQKQMRALSNTRAEISENIRHIRRGTDLDGKAQERRKFIMACPNNTCRGYLSTQYKCELCELHTCSQCLELIGYSKTEPHTCDPNSVASAELIKKDTKPCPQCGVRIFKVSGCDQMWCTECRVSFSYKTLQIDTGATHNPHYYAYMAQQNNGVAPRNPLDVICGGLVQIGRIHRFILPCLKMTHDPDEYLIIASYIQDMHQSIAHISHYELPRIRGTIRELEELQDIRILFILNKITKEELMTTVYRRDTKRKKAVELLHLYEILNAVGIDNFNALIEDSQTFAKNFKQPEIKGNEFELPICKEYASSINEKIVVLDNLRDYCNKRFAKISVTYNQRVMLITDLWQRDTKKYKISEITDAT